MLKNRNIIILIIISIITIAGLSILNDVYLNIRINELTIYLQKIDQKESNVGHVQLIMKYNNSMQLYERTMSRDHAELVDLKISSITAYRTKYKTVRLKKYAFLSIPALHVVNFYRFFLGKEPIRNIQTDKRSSNLDIAYYYERNNLYKKALDYYRKTLVEDMINRNLIGSVMLHQGFSYAMLNRYKDARNLYEKILQSYNNDEIVVVTAAVLLNYLNVFKNEENKISKIPDSIDKSKKLYNLFAFKKALKTLKNVETGEKPSQKAQVDYLKAQYYNEIGMKEKSANLFLKIITDNPKSKYAKLSNRQLYIIGSRLGENNSIKKLAENGNRVYNDNVISTMMKEKNFSLTDENQIGISKKINLNSELLTMIKQISADDNVQDHFAKEEKKSLDKRKPAGTKKISQGKTVPSYIGKKIKVSTKDGSLWIGKVIKSTSTHIHVMTFIGRVNIKKDGIIKVWVLNE